jgi:acyl-CoA hydrolase
MEKVKNIDNSRTNQIHIVFAEDINGMGRLFGGKLVEWMDVVAAVVARRHSEMEVVTVSIDKVDFAAPALLNDTVVIEGTMESVGNSSMCVKVKAFEEKLSGKRTIINTAKFTLVALDEMGKPSRVPRFE